MVADEYQTASGGGIKGGKESVGPFAGTFKVKVVPVFSGGGSPAGIGVDVFGREVDQWPGFWLTIEQQSAADKSDIVTAGEYGGRFRIAVHPDIDDIEQLKIVEVTHKFSP